MEKQREIKFRIWDKTIKCYFSQDRLKGLFCLDLFRNQNFVIQQFTSLLDKNSKEIYEGDIIKQYGEYNQSYNTEVIFAEGRFIPLVKVEYGYNTISEFDNNNFEVIGNIFENSELLK